MRKILKLSFIIALIAICFNSCEKDDQAGPAPVGEGLTDNILASPGDEITFEGTFSTESHFSRISLMNDSLLLNKEIVFANKVSKYYLEYNYTIPEETPFAKYLVKIIAESTDGASQEFSVIVNIASIPEATGVTTKISALPGDAIKIAGSFTDAQGIAAVAMQNSGIGLDTTINISGSPLSYELDYSYTIPASSTQNVHAGQIVVTNISGRSVVYNLEVNLSGEDITYTEMFAAGGFQWWEWNPSHAYIMLPDAADQNWFELIIHAWPEDGYNELKFIGQLDWAPNNWGLIDNTNPSAGMENSESSQAILLDAASSSFYPAYFKVRFNPYDMQYTSEEIDQSGFADQPTMFIVGSGFTDYPNLDWNPEEAIPMVKNPYDYGSHIFLAENLSFSDAVALKFIGQNDGWSPVDVGFDTDYITDVDDAEGGYQVLEPISWVPTKSGDGTADLKFVNQAGLYTVLYDHFAQRAIIWKEEAK